MSFPGMPHTINEEFSADYTLQPLQQFPQDQCNEISDTNYQNYDYTCYPSDQVKQEPDSQSAQWPSPSSTPAANFGSGKKHHCIACALDFDNRLEFQKHLRGHNNTGKAHKCPHCLKIFSNSSYLTQHMRIHLQLRPFGPCQYCGKKFTQLSHLQQHVRTHTGEKPYKCPVTECGKEFTQLSNLQNHSRSHEVDKPFKCNSCYKCYNDEKQLLEHIPSHKKSKHLRVHVCQYCGKSYALQTYLVKHMKKHTDDRSISNVQDSEITSTTNDTHLKNSSTESSVDSSTWAMSKSKDGEQKSTYLMNFEGNGTAIGLGRKAQNTQPPVLVHPVGPKMQSCRFSFSQQPITTQSYTIATKDQGLLATADMYGLIRPEASYVSYAGYDTMKPEHGHIVPSGGTDYVTYDNWYHNGSH